MAITGLLLQEAQKTEHSLWIEVDTSALRHNIKVIKGLLASTVDILAVVKANAYGHGLVPVAEVLSEDVEYFGVYSVDEACQIRRANIHNRILVLGAPLGDDIVRALERDITLSLSDWRQAEQIEEVASKLCRKACVHVHVDTGMGRLGIRSEHTVELVPKLARLPHLFLEGVYTHFASASKLSDRAFTEHQISVFSDLIHRLARAGLEFPFVHAANSAGLIHFPESHFNMVRPGLAVYGMKVPEFTEAESAVPLKPALSLKARLVHMKEMKKGETVGYGRSYMAASDTLIGVLPVGYSHGYPYALSGKGRALFHGRTAPISGKICMDSLMIDLGKDSPAEVGNTVTLIGRDREDEIRAEELAQVIGSNPHEITARLHPEIPRIYL